MIIPKEELTHFHRWQAGSFDTKPQAAAEARTPAPDAPPSPVLETQASEEFKLPTAEDIERMHEEARSTGYQAGFEEGQAAGEQQAREIAAARTQQFVALITNLKNSVTDLEQSVADQLLALAIEIAAQVTRSAISCKPELLLPVIREAVNALPMHHAHIVVRLNPLDIDHVRTEAGEQLGQIGAQLIEDSSVSKGGCLLQAGASEVDASIETRWKRVLEAIGTEPQEWLNP